MNTTLPTSPALIKSQGTGSSVPSVASLQFRTGKSAFAFGIKTHDKELPAFIGFSDWLNSAPLQIETERIQTNLLRVPSIIGNQKVLLHACLSGNRSRLTAESLLGCSESPPFTPFRRLDNLNEALVHFWDQAWHEHGSRILKLSATDLIKQVGTVAVTSKHVTLNQIGAMTTIMAGGVCIIFLPDIFLRLAAHKTGQIDHVARAHEIAVFCFDPHSVFTHVEWV